MARIGWRVQIAALAVLCVVSSAFCAAQGGKPAEAEDGSSAFEYRSGDDLGERFGSMGSSTAKFEETAKRPLSAEPGYFSKKPRYGELVLGDGEEAGHALVFDESRGTGTGYDTLHVDVDNNEDVKEGLKLTVQGGQGGDADQFPVAALQVAYGEKLFPYHASIRRCGSSADHVHVYSAGYCEGTLTAGGKTYKAALFDDNCNGLFSDVHAPVEGRERKGNVYAQGDSLLVDLDGDGEMKKARYGAPEVFPLGKYLSINGECYELTVASHGRSLAFAPCEVECGNFVPPKGGAYAAYLGEHGGLAVHGGGGQVRAPAGTYTLAHCGVEAEDADGKAWRITGRGQWEQPEIKLAAGGKTELVFGAPLTAEVTVDKRSTNEYRLNLKITGQAGEVYSAGDFKPVGSNKRPPAPALKILDAKGETVASGKFEYG